MKELLKLLLRQVKKCGGKNYFIINNSYLLSVTSPCIDSYHWKEESMEGDYWELKVIVGVRYTLVYYEDSNLNVINLKVSTNLWRKFKRKLLERIQDVYNDMRY